MNNKKLFLIERITVGWWLFTTALVVVLWHWLADPVDMICTHALIAVMVGAAWIVGARLMDVTGRWDVQARWIGKLLRIGTPLGMLALWYGETYSFCSLLPYKDHIFASADQWLFGFQPSIVFSEALKDGWLGLPEAVFSEAFNCGYWSYFAMQLVLVLYYYTRHREETDRMAATILASFFCFYLIFFMLPVAGPQYYFQAIGLEQARAGIFPDLGNYFATHTDMLPAPGWEDGLFRHLVKNAQDTGEFPTGAFPSSHIGCTVVFLCLAWRRSRRLFLFLLPFATMLACATVYIHAHYFVDTVAGLVCGLIIYQLLTRSKLLAER
ncbi:MAG: phosphatase PAP2 family protein [Bacteroidaceae bacterium]|nr:phosphatase PAP2 family protein [Bacteroidaceae bacterium]